MRVCLVFLCLMVASFSLFVKSKPHDVKHRGLHKTSHKSKEKDMLMEQANEAQISPTLVTFKANSQEQEYEELNSEDIANYKKENRGFDIGERSDESTAILLSEEELMDILKKEAEEEEVGEKKELGRDIGEEGRGTKNLSETMEIIKDEETDGEKKLNETSERMQDKDDVRNEDKVKKQNLKQMYETEYHMEEEVGKVPYIKKGKGTLGKVDDVRVQGVLLEETDGSSDSEIPAEISYATNSHVLQPLQIVSTAKPNSDDDKGLSQTDIPDVRKEERHEEDKTGGPTIADDYEHDMQNTEAADSREEHSQDELQGNKFDSDSKADARDKINKKLHKEEIDSQKPRDILDIESGPQLVLKDEEEESQNESGNYTRAKPKKQNKNQRMRKHLQQWKETKFVKEWMHQDAPDSEGSSTDNTVNKAKRRRTGKWGSLVGMNPVQIRATVDLFPNSRPSSHPETPYDPCDHFRCKRGKICKLDADHKPSCVCQEPTECPPSVNEFDHVCGTDNKTYDTSCELFAIKCNLEGTKRGHRLHLDYTGPCKLIPQCVDTELVQFPLRMRDWLKNVLLQLYEHDSMSPGFLTSKQRFRVKKMFENERRLLDGDHSIELLAQDFEKNYNMYIYPVHWQFAQLDLFPSDRFLSHSELAPLRVPLVPMEHCTSRFFQECDADVDKQVSFKEWMSCFGIKNDDINVNLLF